MFRRMSSKGESYAYVWVWLLPLMCISIQYTRAQDVQVFYTDTAGAPLANDDVHRCRQVDYYNEARIHILSDAVDQLYMEVYFPVGISYVLNSVQLVSSNVLGAQIVEVGPVGTNGYRFALQPTDLSAGDWFVVRWGRRADCSAALGSAKDALHLQWNGGQYVEDNPNIHSYDVLTASLSMVLSQSTVMVTPLIPTITEIDITNGGLGELEEMTFEIDDGTGTQTLRLQTPNGTLIAPISIVGTVLRYRIDASILSEYGNGNGVLENGEVVRLQRVFRAIECDQPSSTYTVTWGCGADSCQEPVSTQQNIVIVNATPVLDAEVVPTPAHCLDATNAIGATQKTMTVRIVNNGNAPALRWRMFLYSGIIAFEDTWNVYRNDGTPIQTELYTDAFYGSTSRTYRDISCQDVQAWGTLSKRARLGFDTIYPGDTIYVEIPTYNDNLTCGACNRYDVRSPEMYYGLVYYGPCSDVDSFLLNPDYPYSRGYTVSRIGAGYSGAPTIFPQIVYDDQEVRIQISYQDYRLYNFGNGSLHLAIPLAGTCLRYEGAPVLSSRPGVVDSVFVRNDTFFVRFPSGIYTTNLFLLIRLRADCASCGTGNHLKQLEILHLALVDRDVCSRSIEFACTSVDYEVRCITSAGPCEGAYPVSFTLTRTTLGMPDYDNNNVPDANTVADPDSVLTYMAFNGDTVRAEWHVLIHGFATTAPFHYLYFQLNLGNNPVTPCPSEPPFSTVFSALDNAVVEIYPSGGMGPPVVCAVSPVVQDSFATYVVDTNCAGPLAVGDSIVLRALLVAHNSYIRGQKISYTSGSEVYASYVPMPSPTQRYQCSERQSSFVVIGGSFSFWFWTPSSTCTYNKQARLFFIPNQRFPFEYRNYFVPKELTIVFPQDHDFIQLSIGGIPIPNGHIVQLADAIRVVDFDQLFSNYGGPYYAQNQSWWLNVDYVTLRPCRSTPQSYPFEHYWKGRGNGYNMPDEFTIFENGSCTDSVFHRDLDDVDILPQYVLALDGGGLSQVTTSQVEWTINVRNLTNRVVEDVWLYIENTSGSVSNIVLDDGSTTITPDANGFYHLGDYSNLQQQLFAVRGMVDDCADDTLRAYVGLGCHGIPTSPADLKCVADTLVMVAELLPSEVQMELSSTPTVPMALCEEQRIEMRVVSAQLSYLDDPLLEWQVPQGVQIHTPVEVEFPAGSGQVDLLMPTVSGTTMQLALEGHSAIGVEGIPGVAAQLDTFERTAVVRLRFTTDCDYVSGTSMHFTVTGYRPCGEEAIHSGLTVSTGNLSISGAETPYIGTISHQSLELCDTGTLTTAMTIVAAAASNTGDDDTVYIFLPNGLEYIPGTFNCLSAPDCITLVSHTSDAMGNQVLKCVFPTGGIDLGGGPVQVIYQFKVRYVGDRCSDAIPYGTEVVIYYGDIACATQPSGVCADYHVPISSSVDTAFVVKPRLQVDQIQLYPQGFAFFVDATVSLHNNPVEAGDSLVVEFYCVDSLGNIDVVFDRQVVYGPIAVDSMWVMTAVVPSSCNVLNGVMVVAGDSLYSGYRQCLCGQSLQIVRADSMAVGAIGDTVWFDANANGLQDPDEAGVPGVRVLLYDALTDQVIRDTFTDAKGYYIFDYVVPQRSYYLVFELGSYAAQYTWTAQDSDPTDARDSDVDPSGRGPILYLASGTLYRHYDAGMVALSQLGDFVWHDRNGDGIQDAGEEGVAGVVVHLYRKDGMHLRSTVTDASGYYLFENLLPDTYYLRFVLPSGWELTDAHRGTDEEIDSDVDGTFGPMTTPLVVLTGGTQKMDIDMGIYRCAVLGDFVWWDRNRDGIQDLGENGVNGVSIWVYDATTETLITRVFTRPHPVRSSDDGYWQVCVRPGSYYIRVGVPNGYVTSPPLEGSDRSKDCDITHSHGLYTSYTVTLNSGDRNDSLDAGIMTGAIVGDLVWIDLNENGIQDTGEPPAVGVEVRGYDMDGQLQARIHTNIRGQYFLSMPSAEPCYVQFVPPQGYAFTVSHSGVPALDSDVDGSMGEGTTDTMVLPNGTVYRDVDAGVVVRALRSSDIHLSGYYDPALEANILYWEVPEPDELLYCIIQRRPFQSRRFTSLYRDTLHLRTAHRYIDSLSRPNDVKGYVYRIASMDRAGRLSYSNEVVLLTAGTDSSFIQLRPSIAHRSVELVGVGIKQYTHYVLYTAEGVELNRLPIASTIDERQTPRIQISIEHLPAGTYFIQLVGDRRSRLFSFVCIK